MRGRQDRQISMLCALNPEDLVPAEHPLRGVKELADRALRDLDGELEAMYASHGRPSVPPERLLKSMLLMALYSIRSNRQFCEQLRYNLLYRWFLDMDMTEEVWDRTTFSHTASGCWSTMWPAPCSGRSWSRPVSRSSRAATISR